MRKLNKLGLLAIPILALFAATSIVAQAPPPATGPLPEQGPAEGPAGPTAGPTADPQNEPGVARVSYIHGDVSMQRGDSGDVSAVTLNTPLMAGDKVSTGDGSRGEFQLDYANLLRLDQHGQANIAALSKDRIQVQIGQGLANYSVLKGSEAQVEIDTPNVAVHPLKDGRYRIQVISDGESLVTVKEGEAQVSTSEGNTTVKKGQLITVRGIGSDAQFKISEGQYNDDWDKWNKDRDDVIFNATGYRRTNRYYTGAGDLDANGTWSEEPDYGQVWTPRVDPDWAPYRDGRWVWEPYYGWTWVSYESWGWAPYHYGRWFLRGSSWAWWPGPIYPAYRPIWAPAYVSFFGFGGGGFGVGVGFGSIGWLPIGPCDFFHPWWGGFRERFGVVGIADIHNLHDGIGPLHGGERFSNLRNVMANDRLRRGVSGVPSESFGRGSIAARSVAASDLRGGRMMTGNLPVVPTRDSLRASDRSVSSAATARMNTQQRFFSKSAPAARSESFSDQASRVNQAIQRDGRFQAVNASRSGETAGVNRSAGFAGQSPAGQAANSQVRREQQGPAANGGQSFGGSQRGPNGQGQGPVAQPQIRANAQPEFRNNAPATGAQVPRNSNPSDASSWQRFGGSQGASSGQGPVAQPQIRANAQPESRNNVPAGGQSPNNNNPSQASGWQRFSRSGGGSAAAPSTSGRRPTLDMNKPIVNDRSYRNNGDSYGGTSRGNSSPAPAYRPAPNNSAPAYRNYGDSYGGTSRGNSSPAPTYRSAPSNSAPTYRSSPAPTYRSAPAPQYRGGSSGGGSNRGGGSSGGSYRGGGSSGGSSRGSSSSGHSSGGSSHGSSRSGR